MFPILALVVSTLCVVASIRRMRMALAPTAVDPRPIVSAMRTGAERLTAGEVRAAFAEEPEGSWERELSMALEARGEERVGRVNELLREIDHLIHGWARVPRVCASIAASTGFMLASLAMRRGLAVVDDVPLELQEHVARSAVHDAVDVAALGISGAVLCITLGYHGAKLATARLKATDELVALLEAEEGGGPGRGAGTGTGT